MPDVPPLKLADQAVDHCVDPEMPLPPMQPGGGVVESHDNRQPERGSMYSSFEGLTPATLQDGECHNSAAYKLCAGRHSRNVPYRSRRTATDIAPRVLCRNRLGWRGMRIRVSHLKDRKQRRERFAVLTAYDATIAGLLERAGIDVLLVGDSVATAVLGYDTTLPVTLDVMIHHTAAVVRGTQKALVIADMPFLTYQITPSEAVRNAGRLLKDGGAAAVKVEGGQSIVEVVRRLVDVGIPVMGHLGVLPQSVNQQSGYRQRGSDAREAELIVNDALALQDAGAFAIVLEAIPSELAAKITSTLDVPTVGIGAGPDCDGQVLVSSDLLGLHDKVPPFAKKYANHAEVIVNAARAFVADVQATSSTSPVVRPPQAKSGETSQ